MPSRVVARCTAIKVRDSYRREKEAMAIYKWVCVKTAKGNIILFIDWFRKPICRIQTAYLV